MDTTITRPDWSDYSADADRRERNEERAYDKGLEPCFFCGNGVKDPLKHQVHFVTDGTLFPVDEDHDNDPESQGWFSVGPDCAKKLPAGFVTGRA